MVWNLKKSRKGLVKGTALQSSGSPLKQTILTTLNTKEGKLIDKTIKKKIKSKIGKNLAKVAGFGALGEIIPGVAAISTISAIKNYMASDDYTPEWVLNKNVNSTSWKDNQNIVDHSSTNRIKIKNIINPKNL